MCSPSWRPSSPRMDEIPAHNPYLNSITALSSGCGKNGLSVEAIVLELEIRFFISFRLCRDEARIRFEYKSFFELISLSAFTFYRAIILAKWLQFTGHYPRVIQPEFCARKPNTEFGNLSLNLSSIGSPLRGAVVLNRILKSCAKLIALFQLDLILFG